MDSQRLMTVSDRHRPPLVKTEETEFTKLMSGADPFRTLTYKIINLAFADKYRLLRGVLDGPVAVGHSTSNPHVARDPEDEMMKILEGIEMTIRHNHPLLLDLLP
jgi:hypothetical protein